MPQVDEDIMRELMVRATADLTASPAAATAAIRRQRQHRLRTRVLGVAGAAAAAGLAAGTLTTMPGTQRAVSVADGAGQPVTARLTAAQQTLLRLSTAAAGTPRPSGRYVVMTEKSISANSAGREAGGKTSVIDTVTGGGLEYQDIAVSGEDGAPTPPSVLTAAPGSSPTIAQVDAMPTSPAKLAAILLAQAKQQQAEANKLTEQKLALEQKGKGGATPRPVTTPPTSDDLVFEQATDLLWEPDLSPALRAALYKVLADTPGVKVSTGARDSAGRPAVEISRTDTVGKTDVETFENPKTGATLESAWRQASGALDEDLYESISYTNTVPANPYQH
jgi:hypothetical protein